MDEAADQALIRDAMRILTVNRCDIQGGAARAAYRIHHALRRGGTDSTLLVDVASAGDWTVRPSDRPFQRGLARIRPLMGELMAQALTADKQSFQSPAIIPSAWTSVLNRSDADIVHLHWINGEMLSVREIGRIQKPIVWTLHDMWPFCGAEHYTTDSRWRDGYRRDNRSSAESRFDLNRWVWARKRRAWQNPMQIVTPSHWLASCVRESALMREWPVTVVPNAIDTDVWRPASSPVARQLLGLPGDRRLLLFGAVSGAADRRKGFDLLVAALGCLKGEIADLSLVVFGQLAPRDMPDFGFPIHFLGGLHDDVSLRLLYSAADALVIPSRQDNLPNTGVEALACGTPVVAFDTGGLPDIVSHQGTGYLARPFDPEDLASGIAWVLADTERAAGLSARARSEAVRKFSYPSVAASYRAVFDAVLREHA